MRRFRPARLAVPAAALCLLLLAACEDPSGVGLTVLDPSENDPRVRTLPADTAGFAPLADITGADFRTSGFADFRGLAGRVEDPDYGTTSAMAFINLLPRQGLPDGFRERPIQQATLRLRRVYVYGDTLAPTRLDVRQIAEDWAAVGASADTLFPVQEGVITSFDVTASDSLIEVPLPQSWVTANDTTLRSEQISTLFHGFRLSASETSGAVYGFSSTSTLELITSQDTVQYGVSELFSHIEGPEEDSEAATLWPLQDGTGRALELRFDVDALGQAVVNTSFLRVTADTAAASAGLPAGFVRPFARELALYGFVGDETPVLITTADLNEETQTFSFSSPVLTDIFQEFVLERSEVDGFLLGFPAAPSSIDVAPLVRTSAAGCASEDTAPCTGPRAVVILIPSGE